MIILIGQMMARLLFGVALLQAISEMILDICSKIIYFIITAA